MKTKIILLIAFYVVFTFVAHCQSESYSQEYQKFRLSANAGIDFGLGNSNTVLPHYPIGDFILPNSFSGFGANFDGAYFFTTNYGIGIKYHFYTADEKRETVIQEDMDTGTNQTLTFKEKTHFIGPTVHARYFLFGTKWEISANMGVMLLYNNLSKVLSKVRHFPKIQEPASIYQNWNLGEIIPTTGFSDFNGTTVGFTASASIGYRITSVLGAGLRTDGFFASLSKMKNKNGYNICRQVNRIGVSVELSVNF
jgi:hypothetical protein